MNEEQLEIERLKTRVRELEAEVNTLRTTTFKDETQDSGGAPSILGLKSMFIHLDDKNVVRNTNKSMLALLKMKKEEAVGKTLAEIDKFHFAPGILSMLLGESKKSGKTAMKTVEYEEADENGKEEKKVLEIKATVQDGYSQVLIDDIADEVLIKDLFSRFVAPEVIDTMMSMKEEDWRRPNRREMTVMFADIRKFVETTENMDPIDVKTMIDEYLELGLNIIWKAGGTVDKVIGDAIMALFGAPVWREDHALLAINTSVSIQKAFEQLRRKWELQGKPSPTLGISINTGEMMVGNIGAKRFLNYTVLGREVNLASRINEIAEGGMVVIGQNTLKRIELEQQKFANTITHPIRIRSHGKIKAKGFDDLIQTYYIKY
ncbi:MAG: adenylate/guanylate cyclase domain-containing protein [Planctomycetes bacterium]|nr:adenylate/guanylate cyclase domain-containing protein [Planctomycetota bacterium]